MKKQYKLKGYQGFLFTIESSHSELRCVADGIYTTGRFCRVKGRAENKILYTSCWFNDLEDMA